MALTEAERALAHESHKSPQGVDPDPCRMCEWYVIPAVERILSLRAANEETESRCNDTAEPECNCKPGDRLADCQLYLAATCSHRSPRECADYGCDGTAIIDVEFGHPL